MTPSPKPPPKPKTPTATKVAIYTLGGLLGFIHVFIGVVALTPLISSDYHREIELNYNAFAKTLPSFYNFGFYYVGVYNFGFYYFEVGYDTVCEYSRLLISAYQIALGIGQLENGHFSGSCDNVANYGLLALDSVVLAFQCIVGLSYKCIALTILCLILLGGRAMLIIGQSEKVQEEKDKRVSLRSTSTCLTT